MNLDRLKIRLHRLSVEYTFSGGYAKNTITKYRRKILSYRLKEHFWNIFRVLTSQRDVRLKFPTMMA